MGYTTFSDTPILLLFKRPKQNQTADFGTANFRCRIWFLSHSVGEKAHFLMKVAEHHPTKTSKTLPKHLPSGVIKHGWNIFQPPWMTSGTNWVPSVVALGTAATNGELGKPRSVKICFAVLRMMPSEGWVGERWMVSELPHQRMLRIALNPEKYVARSLKKHVIRLGYQHILVQYANDLSLYIDASPNNPTAVNFSIANPGDIPNLRYQNSLLVGLIYPIYPHQIGKTMKFYKQL